MDHDTQPREQTGAFGLAAEHDDPGVLARVFDQLVWRVDGAGDGSQQVAVVSAVQLGFNAVLACRRATCGFRAGFGFALGSVGGCMRPDLGAPPGQRSTAAGDALDRPGGGPDTPGRPAAPTDRGLETARGGHG